MTYDIVVSVIVGTCLAGFVQGLSGFAFGLVAMSVWSWSLAPQLAAPMVVFGSIVGQSLGIMAIGRNLPDATRHAIHYRRVVRDSAGVWLWRYVDPVMFQGGVGIYLICYCTVMCYRGTYRPSRVQVLCGMASPVRSAASWAVSAD